MGDEITFDTIVLKLIEKTQTGVSVEEDTRVFDRYDIYIGRSERLLTAVVEQVGNGRK